jgi:hypothetical protein
MAETRKIAAGRKRNNLPGTSPVFRRGGDSLRLSPGRAVLLSLLSWPEPGCPAGLKPIVVLVATLIWLALAVLATNYGPSAGFWPVLPVAAVFLMAGFVGGSLIAMLTAILYSLALHFGWLDLDLPDVTREMLTSGYTHKDFIMLLVFVWLCGVPHWRRKFSWFFTLLWGTAVVFAPVIFVLISLYGFYGQLPPAVMNRLLNRDFLIAWGVTVIIAAIAAKILYLIKDFLRRADFDFSGR